MTREPLTPACHEPRRSPRGPAKVESELMPNHPTKAARAGRAWRARGLACLSAALLSGCAVGPDFVAPPAPPVKGFLPGTAKTGAPDEHMAVGADIPGQWWEVYHSPALKTLVERALKQNADLEAAQAALRAARENGIATRGALFPTVSAGFNPTAGRVGSDLSSPLASGAQTYSLTTAQLTVAYSPDVFGLTRRTIESADAQTRLARFQLEAAYLALTSNVVNAAVQEASLRAQIEATHKIIAAETELLNVLRRQFNLGQAAVADMLAQEAALAQAEQTLPPLEKALGLNRDLLTALTGQYSSDEITEKFALESLQLPHALPVSLPSALVQHRPDIRAAEANLNSASALIGVAIANRLPLVSLTAQTGSSAANLANLFVPATAFYALGGNVTQTIFDAGTLLHRQKQAEAEFDQAYAQYRSTVIGAFQNVADALRAIEADARAEKAAKTAETAAAKSLAVVRKQLEYGQISTIALLNAQQTYNQAVLALVQAKAGRYSDTAALFQALGGGWWNRPPPPGETW